MDIEVEQIDHPTVAPRRPRMDSSAAAALLAEQEQSGLSIRAFAELRGIRVENLYRWRHRLRQLGGDVPPLIRVVDEPGCSMPGSRPALVLPGGIRLEHPELLTGDQLRTVLAAC